MNGYFTVETKIILRVQQHTTANPGRCVHFLLFGPVSFENQSFIAPPGAGVTLISPWSADFLEEITKKAKQTQKTTQRPLTFPFFVSPPVLALPSEGWGESSRAQNQAVTLEKNSHLQAILCSTIGPMRVGISSVFQPLPTFCSNNYLRRFRRLFFN